VNKYMHLIDGQPAYFHEPDRRLYVAHSGITPDQLFVDDLQKIRRQQELSQAKQFARGGAALRLSYLRVKVK
jgi:hypothetical protein